MDQPRFIRFSGTLHTDGSFEPEKGWTTTRVRKPPRPNSRYVVESLNECDTTIAAVPAQVTHADDVVDETGLPAERLLAYLPLTDEARTVRLRLGDRELHRADIAPAAPVVSDLRVEVSAEEAIVRWTAAHDRPLTFNVFITDIRLQTYTITTHLNETRLSLDLAALPCSGTCTISVLATDGLRSGHATSGSFEVPDQPPIVALLSPVDGGTVSPLPHSR